MRIPGLPTLPPVPESASGRLQLAQWIASSDNPLTARVFVNRVWAHLFGRGIVPLVDEFGSVSEEPLQRGLLDYLAQQFLSRGWSVKQLIREIVLSRTYRQGQAPPDRRSSPELFGGAVARRLEWEALRDSLLAVSGRLSFERPRGIQVAGTGGKARGASTYSLLPLDAPCRTVYLPVLRSLLRDEFSTFDFPDPHQITGQREVTTVAPQALFFLNSDFVVDCARAAAQQLLNASTPSDADRAREAFLRILSREPDADEIRAAITLLADFEPPESSPDPNLYRWTAFVQALMSSAEFRYVH